MKARLAKRPRVDLAVPAAMVGASIVFLIIHRSVIDDVFITLSYGRNLVDHWHWGVTGQLTANSATSPLNVVVLGSALALFRSPFAAVGAVFVASVGVFTWALRATAQRLGIRPWAPLVVVAILLFNPLLLSVVGMETTTLGLALLGIALLAAVEGRPVRFGAIVGLMLLTRLDFAILVLPIALAAPAIRRQWLRSAAVAAAVALPWYALSWFALGSAIPDTLTIKRSQAWPASFVDGPRWYATRDTRVGVLVAFAPWCIGLAALAQTAVLRLRDRARLRPGLGPVLGLVLGGVAYWVGYAVLDPPPYLWYYGPTTIALTSGGVLLLASTPGRRRPRVLGRVIATVLAAVIVSEIIVIASNARKPWTRPPIVGNVASAPDYLRIGRALRAKVGSAPIATRTEVGALAFGCQCDTVDAFSDRGLVIPLIDKAIDDEPGPVGQLMRTNYARLDRSQLPIVVRYYLEFGPGPATERDSWTYRNLLNGGSDHLTLRRSPATPRRMAAMSSGVRAGLGGPGADVVLHIDTGGDDTTRAELYEYALMHHLRASGIRARLAISGRRGRAITIATGQGVTRALREPPARVLFYRGRTTLPERRELDRADRALTRRHEEGTIDARTFLKKILKVRSQIGDEVIVYRGI